MSSNIREMREDVERLKESIKDAEVSARDLQTGLNRSLGLVRRFTGQENINKGISEMQRAMMVARQLQIVMVGLESVSGPVGWALLGLGVISAAVSTGELIYDSLGT